MADTESLSDKLEPELNADDFRRVKRIDSCEIHRLRLQMVPTFGRGRVDVVDDGIPAGFEYSILYAVSKKTC